MTKKSPCSQRAIIVVGAFSRSLIHHFLIESLSLLIFLFFPNLCWLQLPYWTYFYLPLWLHLIFAKYCTFEPMLSGCPTLWPQFTILFNLTYVLVFFMVRTRSLPSGDIGDLGLWPRKSIGDWAYFPTWNIYNIWQNIWNKSFEDIASISGSFDSDLWETETNEISSLVLLA